MLAVSGINHCRERTATMIRSLPSSVSQIFVDARQPGSQGVLEVFSFLMVIGMLSGAFAMAAMLLLYAVS
jgi:hypothetical protein